MGFPTPLDAGKMKRGSRSIEDAEVEADALTIQATCQFGARASDYPRTLLVQVFSLEGHSDILDPCPIFH
jgi:hypothetical protein